MCDSITSLWKFSKNLVVKSHTNYSPETVSEILYKNIFKNQQGSIHSNTLSNTTVYNESTTLYQSVYPFISRLQSAIPKGHLQSITLSEDTFKFIVVLQEDSELNQKDYTQEQHFWKNFLTRSPMISEEHNIVSLKGVLNQRSDSSLMFDYLSHLEVSESSSSTKAVKRHSGTFLNNRELPKKIPVENTTIDFPWYNYSTDTFSFESNSPQYLSSASLDECNYELRFNSELSKLYRSVSYTIEI